jgi:hypothetical protein
MKLSLSPRHLAPASRPGLNATIAILCSLISLVCAHPAHAQWVANQPIPTPGVSNNPQSESVYSPGATAQATPVNGAVTGDTFECNVSDSGMEPAYSGCSANAGFSGEWTITYSWTGTGTGPAFTVPIQLEGHGLASASGTAGGGCSGGANGYTGSSGNGGFNKPTVTHDSALSPTSPSLTVTISAGCSGTVASTPAGGSFSDSAEADAMVGVPIY